MQPIMRFLSAVVLALGHFFFSVYFIFYAFMLHYETHIVSHKIPKNSTFEICFLCFTTFVLALYFMYEFCGMMPRNWPILFKFFIVLCVDVIYFYFSYALIDIWFMQHHLKQNNFRYYFLWIFLAYPLSVRSRNIPTLATLVMVLMADIIHYRISIDFIKCWFQIYVGK